MKLQTFTVLIIILGIFSVPFVNPGIHYAQYDSGYQKGNDGPYDSGYQGPYQGPYNSSYQGPYDSSYQGPYDNSYQGSYQSQYDSGYNGPYNGNYASNYNNSDSSYVPFRQPYTGNAPYESNSPYTPPPLPYNDPYVPRSNYGGSDSGYGPGGENDPRCIVFPNAPGCDSGPLTDGTGGKNKDKEPPKKNIKGRVWYDWDQNKRQNNGEPGIRQIKVESNPRNGNDTTNGDGDYEIKNQEQDRYTVKVNDKSWKTTSKDAINVNLNQGNARNVDFGLFKGYVQEIRIFADLNGNGALNSGEPGLEGIGINIRHTRLPGRINDDDDTNAQGIARLNGNNGGAKHNGIPGGGSDYDTTVQGFSTGFVPSDQNPFRFSINRTSNQDPPTRNFGLIPQWQVRGYVFIDTDGDRIKDTNEDYLTEQPQIGIEGRNPWNQSINYGPSNPNANLVTLNTGFFEIHRLLPGEYFVHYTPPQGMSSYPGGATPYVIHVGDGFSPFNEFACSDAEGERTTSPAAINTTYCSSLQNSQGQAFSGNVLNLSFAIQVAEPWYRSYGLDMRFDNGISIGVPGQACDGTYASLPSGGAPSLPSVLTPGILVSGTPTLEFNPGQASEYNWKVSNAYTPPTPDTIRTSYAQIDANLRRSGVAVQDFRTADGGCPNINSCTPDSDDLRDGIYRVSLAEGEELRIINWNVPDNKNFVLLVDGNLRVGPATGSSTNTINVGYTNASLTVIVKGNIIVEDTVGQPRPYTCPSDNNGVQQGDTHIDGFFSTDQNFEVESSDADGECPAPAEKILNMSGSIVVNAGLNGGRFVNNRDLCGDNPVYPSFTIRARPDLILNTPDIIKIQNLEYRELAP